MPRHAPPMRRGVVITREAADEYVPLSTNDGGIVTQFTRQTIEELGPLPKMDFHGPAHPAESTMLKMVRRLKPDFSIAGIFL